MRNTKRYIILCAAIFVCLGTGCSQGKSEVKEIKNSTKPMPWDAQSDRENNK